MGVNCEAWWAAGPAAGIRGRFGWACIGGACSRCGRCGHSRVSASLCATRTADSLGHSRSTRLVQGPKQGPPSPSHQWPPRPPRQHRDLAQAVRAAVYCYLPRSTGDLPSPDTCARRCWFSAACLVPCPSHRSTQPTVWSHGRRVSGARAQTPVAEAGPCKVCCHIACCPAARLHSLLGSRANALLAHHLAQKWLGQMHTSLADGSDAAVCMLTSAL
ncbi:hypothetical protein T440DRAFT_4330 [Plenodomus tracheiphilus IPT5]|uniref:Uncharacterized protein n=1 Tax=Plenodomus tracheiphilus IPT5 TaxID=1408161 RepID=A0A6A7BMG8_9PLEO|nr:hypothetical protein T440DRAFT_4330 [Plenodomus tracheiphilus IPT5]